MTEGISQKPHFDDVNKRFAMWPRLDLARATNFFKHWRSSGAVYGAAGIMIFIYLTEWRVITTKLPIYNTKFAHEEVKK